MAVLLVMAAGVTVTVYALCEAIVTRSLREDATTTALAWRSHFAGNIGNLENASHNNRFTPQQMDFITATAKVGRVFRFRLFDARGRLVLESDKAGAPPIRIGLREHDTGAVEAIEFQRTIVEVFRNVHLQGAPAAFAEAHVPVLAQDGEVLGLIEIHIDQSLTARLFQQALHGFALSLGAFIAATVLGLSLLSSFRHKFAGNEVAALPEDNASESLANARIESLLVLPALRYSTAAAESFDDWLARVTEDAAQSIPERISFECHLGLGDALMPFNTEQMERLLRGLVAEAATALSISSEDSSDAVVFMPRILVSTRLAKRGIEVRISDNRLQPRLIEGESLTGLHELAIIQGGGLYVHEAPGSGATTIVWWPNPLQQAKAA